MALYLNTPVQVSCWHFWDITSKQYRRAVCMPVPCQYFSLSLMCAFHFMPLHGLICFLKRSFLCCLVSKDSHGCSLSFQLMEHQHVVTLKKKKKKKEPSSANLVEFMTALWPLHKDMTYHRKQVLLHFTVMAFY